MSFQSTKYFLIQQEYHNPIQIVLKLVWISRIPTYNPIYPSHFKDYGLGKDICQAQSTHYLDYNRRIQISQIITIWIQILIIAIQYPDVHNSQVIQMGHRYHVNIKKMFLLCYLQPSSIFHEELLTTEERIWCKACKRTKMTTSPPHTYQLETKKLVKMLNRASISMMITPSYFQQQDFRKYNHAYYIWVKV